MSRLPRRKRALISLSLTSFALLVGACASQKDPIINSASQETIVSSTPPFQTKEPERYGAIRTITTVTADGQTVVTNTLIARDGEMRRHESQVATKKLVYLDVPDGRFVLLPNEKSYADLTAEPSLATNDEPLEISPDRLLHTEAGDTSYQRLGAEVIAGRNANKYRIVVNSASAQNVSLSETLMWIDEALKIPIRSETTSSDGTRMTMELSDIALEVDRSLFKIPDGYEKVTFRDLRKMIVGINSQSRSGKSQPPR